MIGQISKFLFGSVITQGLGAVSGLLIAHWMAVEDYAIFTIMMTITGAMTVLTKGGVHFGFSAIMGRIWPDRNKAAQAIDAAIKERRIISVLVLPPLLIFSSWLLFKNNATCELIASLLALLLLHWVFDMRTRLIDQILMFANRAPIIQGLDTLLALVRVTGIVGLYFLTLLQPLGVCAIGVFCAGLRVPFISKWTKQELPRQQVRESQKNRLEIRKITRRQIPLEFFYVLQSQIVLVILAWYSATESTASVGALGRIGQLLLPVQAVLNAFAIPRFSSKKEHIFRSWILWLAVGSIPGLGLIAIALYVPHLLLLLIGPNYAELQYELLIFCIGAAVNSSVTIAWQLLAHRGWNQYAWLQIPVLLAWFASAPYIFNLSRLDHVLWFQAAFPVGLIVVTIVEWIGVKSRKKTFHH